MRILYHFSAITRARAGFSICVEQTLRQQHHSTKVELLARINSCFIHGRNGYPGRELLNASTWD